MPKVGDMVRVFKGPDREFCGTVVDIVEEDDLFSEKYAIMETNTYFHVLCSGVVKVFDEDEWYVEVIDETG